MERTRLDSSKESALSYPHFAGEFSLAGVECGSSIPAQGGPWLAHGVGVLFGSER